VLSIAHREGRIPRNPAAQLGELMRRVERVAAHEVPEAEAWTREEVATLLAVTREFEPRFAPLLHFLLATGCRRGEAFGLRWGDVDFARGRVVIPRAITSGQLTTPKNGKGRSVAMPPALAAELFDILSAREPAAVAGTVTRLDGEVPEWVFCSLAGTPLDERNVTRSWSRVRRRAAKLGVRPLKLHAARHTYASLAFAAGKSIRWVAAQLGHASAAFTLRTYVHAMPEESDLGFADFCLATPDAVARRRYPSPQKKEGSARHANPSDLLVELGGIEPPTPRLPALCSPS
jgi:integrase